MLQHLSSSRQRLSNRTIEDSRLRSRIRNTLCTSTAKLCYVRWQRRQGGVEALKLAPLCVAFCLLTSLGRKFCRTPHTLLWKRDTIRKTEVHNVLYYCQKKTEPPPWLACTENFMKFGHLVFDACERTDKHTDTLIAALRALPGRSNEESSEDNRAEYQNCSVLHCAQWDAHT